MDEAFEKKIKEQINKSGFPLELDVFERIRQQEHIAFPNLSYVDFEGKPHKIDILVML